MWIVVGSRLMKVDMMTVTKVEKLVNGTVSTSVNTEVKITVETGTVTLVVNVETDTEIGTSRAPLGRITLMAAGVVLGETVLVLEETVVVLEETVVVVVVLEETVVVLEEIVVVLEDDVVVVEETGRVVEEELVLPAASCALNPPRSRVREDELEVVVDRDVDDPD